MLTAKRAKLLELETIGSRLLVLHIAVIAVLTLATGENDLVSGHGWTSGSGTRKSRRGCHGGPKSRRTLSLDFQS